MRQGQWQRQRGGSGRLLFALVGGVTAFALANLWSLGKFANDGNAERNPGKHPAYDPEEPAASRDAGAPGTVRSAGPESMRDGKPGRWDEVDEASDESFPASDPPANY